MAHNVGDLVIRNDILGTITKIEYNERLKSVDYYAIFSDGTQMIFQDSHILGMKRHLKRKLESEESNA